MMRNVWAATVSYCHRITILKPCPKLPNNARLHLPLRSVKRLVRKIRDSGIERGVADGTLHEAATTNRKCWSVRSQSSTRNGKLRGMSCR